MQLTPEERQRRSEAARRLHREGKFGGPQPGSGRPRKKRAAELAAEKAAEHAEEIVGAFLRGVRSPDEKVAVMSAQKWLEMENKEAALQLQEQKHIDSLSRDELIRNLAEGFARLKRFGVDFTADAEASEADVIELEPGAVRDVEELYADGS